MIEHFCCLCREPEYTSRGTTSTPLEPSTLPGTGWRCIDRYACSQRVRSIIDTHKAFAQACED